MERETSRRDEVEGWKAKMLTFVERPAARLRILSTGNTVPPNYTMAIYIVLQTTSGKWPMHVWLVIPSTRKLFHKFVLLL